MRLRAAASADGATLLAWANDPGTRQASGNRPPVEWDHHRDWLAGRLGHPGTLFLIGESAAGQAVGSIRFETRDDWRTAVLSYVVAPEARGQGFGRALLVEGVSVLRRRYPSVRIEASVAEDNVASRRLFGNLGWDGETGEAGRIRFVDQGGAAA